MTIKDLINKIKWNKNLNPDDYTLIYIDRIDKNKKKMNFTDIEKIEGSFLMLTKEDKEVNIPLHRIREVRKQGKLVWKR